VKAFQDWLAGTQHHDVEPDRRLKILARVHTLRGMRLGCYCAPLPCHGDVLARLADGEAA